MAHEQSTFEHSAAIERLADAMAAAGCLMTPDQLFRFLQIEPATLDMIRKLVTQAHAVGWNNGAEETEIRLSGYPHESEN